MLCESTTDIISGSDDLICRHWKETKHIIQIQPLLPKQFDI